MQLQLPKGAIVLCIGPSNSGKSTLLEKLIAERQLLHSEVVSSDTYRELVSDIQYIDFSTVPREEQDVLYEDYQQLSTEAFHVLHEVVSSRAKLNKVTFVDATHLRQAERAKYIDIAKNTMYRFLPLYLIYQKMNCSNGMSSAYSHVVKASRAAIPHIPV